MAALSMNSLDDDPLDRLIKSFHTLLDEPLVVAIAGDHDLTTSAGYNAAEQTLKGLSQDVVIEEATVFGPSGASGLDDTPAQGIQDHASATSQSNGTSSHQQHASLTDASSTDRSEYIPQLTSFNDDSDETKFLNLRSMFGDLKDIDIRYALQKFNGNFQAALDSLLDIQNRIFEGENVRGIDAFFDDSEEPSSKGRGKKKGKKRTGKAAAFDLDVSTKEVLTKNQVKELKHQDEIAFLADHLLQPFDHVSDVYYRKKTSNGATAAAILDQYSDLGITSEDEGNIATAKRLANEHPKVPERYFLTLLQVTDQGTQDIAALLSKHFTKNPHKERLQLTHPTTPLPNEDLEGHAGSLPGSKPLTPGSSKSPRSESRASSGGMWDHAEVVKRINEANRSRLDASAQSTSMIRKGGYYRQGAVVYHERAREQALHSHAMSSAAADLLVDKQSSRNKIDLHGVSVRDGVRIARTRVQAWWDNLGEFRIRKAREDPYTVVTGLGRHSASGVSQLRQAVLAALFQDGWKASVETGCFVVTGRR